MSDTMLSPYETYEFKGVIYYNNSNMSCLEKDCQIVGIETESHQFIFPKGIQCDVGMKKVYERLGKPESIDGFTFLYPESIASFWGENLVQYKANDTDKKTVYEITHKTRSGASVQKIRYEHW